MTGIPANPRTGQLTSDIRAARLAELVAGRHAVLDRVTTAARASGAKALLLIGSLGRSGGDPFSDLDLIIVPGPAFSGLDLPALFGDEVLAQLEAPQNAPVGGSYVGMCLDVAQTVLWVDVFTWPPATAAIPADGTVAFDNLGLPHSDLAFIPLLTRHSDPNAPAHSPTDVNTLLQVAVAAKYLARNNLDRLADKVPEAESFCPTTIPGLLRQMLRAIDDRALTRAVTATATLVDLAAACAGDTGMSVPVDWSRWSVILLKPDCVARGLADPVLTWIGQHVAVVDRRIVVPTEQQIFAHYHDLLTTRLAHFTWVDVPADLRRTYVGQQVGIALAYGEDAAPRLRELIGDFDPVLAGPATIRGRFGTDSLRQAKAEGRLIANVIHTSDDPTGTEREFGIWYGLDHQHLLQPPTNAERSSQ